MAGEKAQLLLQHETYVDEPGWIDTNSLYHTVRLMVVALINGRCNFVNNLLKHHANIDLLLLRHMFETRCRRQIIRLIFSCPNFHVNRCDYSGRTPLSFAVDYQDRVIVSMLLHKGAIPRAPEKCWVYPPLVTAVEKRNVAITKLLLEYGAGADINYTNYRKNSPLMETVRQMKEMKMTRFGNQGNHDRYKSTLNIIQLLVHSGADINLVNLNGYTAFLLACCYSDRTVVSLLIEAGSDVHAKCDNGVTALILASKGNDEEIVSLLLERGCDVNAVNKYKQTALSMAVQNGNEAIIRLLLAKGASMEIAGESFLLLTAIGNNTFSSFRCLIELGADVNCTVQGQSMLTYLMESLSISNVHLLTPFIKHAIIKGAKVSSAESILAVHKCIVWEENELLSTLIHNGGFSPAVIDKHHSGRYNKYRDIARFIQDGICSPLCMALISDKHKIARQLWNHCFLTSSDINLLQKHREFRSELGKRRLTKSSMFLKELSSSVPSLFQLSFVQISELLGSDPGRREKVEQLGLPPRLQRHLTFSFDHMINTDEDSDSEERNNGADPFKLN